MSFKPKLISSAILSSLLLAPYAAMAEEETVETGKMTVTGILPDRLDAVPGSYSIIDEEYLEERRPISNIERLRTVPGLNVVPDGSMGFDTNIGIRGQNPRRSAKTMVMEDGIPLQLAPYGDPVVHYTTPSSALSRVEVIKGANQILYGPQTLGGAVNFITKPVPRSGEVEGSVTSAFGNQDYRLLDGNIGYGGDVGGFMFGFTQNKGDGIYDGSEFDVKDYRFKGELDITDRQTIGLKLIHTRDRRNQTENYLTRDEYDRDPYSHPTVDLDDWEQDRDVIQLTHAFQVNDNFRLSSQAYYTDTFRNGLRASNSGREVNGQWESRLRNCDAIGDTNNDGNTTTSDLEGADINLCGGRHAPRQYYTWGAETRADFSHNLFGLENDAIVGVRYHRENIHRQQVFATNTAQREDYDLALINGEDREGAYLETRALSYFAQNTFYVGDNWAITPGFRVENVSQSEFNEFDSTDRESLSYTEFLPSFGVAWNGIDNTTIFAGVHKGIAPARADREFTDDGGRADPEESTLYEVGVRSNYFKGIAFETTLFHNDIQNTLIDFGDTFDNSGDSKQTGLEVAGRINFGDIYNTTNNFYISAAYTNLWTAEYEDGPDPTINGNRMQYAPEHLLNMDVGYEHSSGVHARIGVQHVSKQFVDDGNTRIETGNGIEGTIPSYTIWNASMNYRIPNSSVTLFAVAENLFDKEYLVSRNEGKLVGRERLFFGGITYDF
ncbi:TonB-dependent receptor family protein [Methylophaga sp. OBS3]|uniref:TonB-dependent receptor family protein n=1 Tax=Methylophaga sp. OBS3 TaxID=2991934 RepID=UPI00224F49E2|nr:TonB-dependent receptor [Methylophaga sp. OBS3]MCX4189781.1 TonB-dependent receptor [Methylophaga sp. OBS3]